MTLCSRAQRGACRFQYHRVNQKPVLVDEVMPHERPCQLSASGNQNVLSWLLLQARYLLGNITPDQVGIIPLQVVQGLRGDVLGEGVHPIGKARFIGL